MNQDKGMGAAGTDERETFLRVWQRVSAPAQGGEAAQGAAYPPVWEEAEFLDSALSDNALRMGLCRGSLRGLQGALLAQRRRLMAAAYLLTGERRREEPGQGQRDLTQGQRCRELYRLCLRSQSAFAAAAGQDTPRRGLYRALAEENRALAERVQGIVEQMMQG